VDVDLDPVSMQRWLIMAEPIGAVVPEFWAGTAGRGLH
jgi:hypothetical protein